MRPITRIVRRRCLAAFEFLFLRWCLGRRRVEVSDEWSRVWSRFDDLRFGRAAVPVDNCTLNCVDG